MLNISNIHQKVDIQLSVLIPITPDRWDVVKNVLRHFDVYRYGSKYKFSENGLTVFVYSYPVDNIEVIVAEDNKEMTLGEKRELLYQLARGEYSIQVDSDDDLADDFQELVMSVITEGYPDCVTYQESVVMDGVRKTSNHSFKYEKWQDNFDGYDYTRTVFYKDVIKTPIARQVPFPKIRWNEDEQWSMALMPLIKDEVHIDKELYLYQYTSTPFNERYGIKE